MMEPKPGGLIVETSADEERFVWGHVTQWNKPAGLDLAWYVGRTVDTATVIRVAFDPLDAGKTRIRLEQSGWEAPGEAAADRRERNDTG